MEIGFCDADGLCSPNKENLRCKNEILTTTGEHVDEYRIELTKHYNIEIDYIKIIEIVVVIFIF